MAAGGAGVRVMEIPRPFRVIVTVPPLSVSASLMLCTIAVFADWNAIGSTTLTANQTAAAPIAHTSMTFLLKRGSFLYGGGAGSMGSRLVSSSESNGIIPVSCNRVSGSRSSGFCIAHLLLSLRMLPEFGDRTIIATMITTVRIKGMSCAHCVRAVFTALGGVEGVSHADVSIGQAVIEHDGTVSQEAIAKAISIAGYDVADFKSDRRALPVV